MCTKPSLFEELQDWAAVLAATKNIVTGQATQPEVPSTTVQKNSSVDQSHVQSDLSNKTSSNSVTICKPMTKTQLEVKAWKPSYAESREPSEENDYASDYSMITFDSELEAGEDSAPGLSFLNRIALWMIHLGINLNFFQKQGLDVVPGEGLVED